MAAAGGKRSRDDSFFCIRLESRPDAKTGQVRGVVEFSAEEPAGLPVVLFFLIDTSSSFADCLETTKKTILRVAEASGKDDKIAVASFDETSRMLVVPTSSVDDVRAGLDRAETRRGTNIEAALLTTAEQISKLDTSAYTVHVILITDGTPTQGQKSRS